MIPVFQTHTIASMDAPVPGNCTQAAVASILDLPLDAVPHFLLFDNAWDSALVVYLAQHGHGLEVWTSRDEWVAGWQRRDIEARDIAEAPTDGLLLASGWSPRGDWLHMVVWDAASGTVAHDPHPDGTGIVGDPVELWRIV